MFSLVISYFFILSPGLAKFGIAPGLGPGGRGFKSRSPDQNIAAPMRTVEATSRPATLLWVSVDISDETAKGSHAGVAPRKGRVS